MRKNKKGISVYFNKKALIVGDVLTIALSIFWITIFVMVVTSIKDDLFPWFLTGFFSVASVSCFFMVGLTGADAHMVFSERGIEYRRRYKKSEFHSYSEYAYVYKTFYMYYGMPMYYIVLSNRLRNEEICQINSVKTSPMLIRIRYNKKNYESILSMVPSRIALSLQAQFKDVPPKRFNFCI